MEEFFYPHDPRSHDIMDVYRGRHQAVSRQYQMIGKLFANLLWGIGRGRKARRFKRNIRRFSIEPLESRRLLAATGSISGFAYLDTHDLGVKDANEAGFAGLTVELRSVDSQGNLGSASGVGPTQTASDGSYSFTGLSAGTYQVQIVPSSKLSLGKLSPGSAGGAAGTNEVQLTLADSQAATDYNFAILGAQTQYISLRMALASTGTLSHFLTTLHAAPTVATANSGTAYKTSYATGSVGVSVVSSNASIADTDSPTLTSMIVAVQNPSADGGDMLSATTTNTPLTSSYSGGVLSISGVADVSTYASVLQSVTYRNTNVTNASAAGNRAILVTVNDGTLKSEAATSTITVVQGTATAPTVSGINPAAGSLSGGTSVTITGSGFTGATSVLFGTKSATSFTVVSDTQITATSPAATTAGAVDVTVVNPVGTSATGTADHFSYGTAPAVSNISLNAGALGGGTSVTITGSGFTGATSVLFGTTSTTNFTVVSDTQITATSPAATTVGIVDVTVVNPSGTSATGTVDKFTYTAVATVSNISPKTGVLGGGTSVTIIGSGFTGATSVLFGTTPATNFTVVSDTQITAASPVAATAGVVDVTVVNPVGSSATSAADRFSYTTVPAVLSINPNTGALGGGTSVTITGSGFTGATSVLFGTTSTTNFTVVSDTQITAISPAATTVGMVDVTVVNPLGTSATGTVDKFTYTAVATVSNISPKAGVLGGGTSVTITGSGFTGATSVLFGTTPATNFTVVSDTQITATSPPATTAGTVDVTVVNPVGTSAAGTADKFTYTTVPAVLNVNPETGALGGGTPVTITGSGFTAATSVLFGTTPAANFTVVSDTQVTATSPVATTVGTVDVTVVNPLGTSATGTVDKFTYTRVAAVSNISPNAGALVGGTSVTITGSDFTGATSVLFGTTPAASFTVVSDTQITATSPAATTAGAVDVTVVNPSGTSATGTVDKFTYTTAAIVSNISPNTGALGGGTSVTITGSGLTGATSVLFGTTPATSFTVVSNTQITATSPVATTAGAVDVTVVNLMGTSATSAADKFTYTLTVTGVSTTQATGSYGLIDTATTPISITVTFSGPVTVTGAPQLTLNTLDASGAANNAVVNYAGGSGTDTLTFNYTIAAGQNSTRLDYITPPGSGQSALSLNGGTIQDAAGNAVDLTSLPAPGAAADGLYTKNIVINTVPPSGYAVTPDPTVYGNSNADSAGFTISGQNGELYTGDVYNYTISSTGGSEQVTGSGTVTSTTSSQTVSGIDLSSLPNGTLTFSVTLTDVSGNIGAPATATASLAVLDITSPTTVTATAGQVFTYAVQTNAPSGDAITVTPGTALPTGMTFDAATATFTWTPTADLAGTTSSFTATVNDTTLNNTATLGVYVMVAAANGLTVIAPAADVANGSPVLVAFNDANAGTPAYTVTTSSSSDPTGSNLTVTLMPQSNQVLKILTDQGEMDIQLFDNYTPNTVNHFLDLVNAGTYTDTSFYRIIQDFMIQGGSGGTGGAIPVELNANLRFTSSGLLAMANNGVDGNTSEFFVTGPNDMSNGFLDFRYTIFGKLISGDNVRQALAATPVTTNQSSGEDSQPLKAPKILSMSVTTEQTAGVVMLQAAPGASVGDTYTVTVRDGLGATQSFQIHIGFNGPFQLQVGSTATGQMQFDSSNPAVTAANMQSALQAAGSQRRHGGGSRRIRPRPACAST